MLSRTFAKYFFLIYFLSLVVEAHTQTLSLHPENPHYFLYKGKARIFISSAEHYGAVLNLDFDYKKYLKTLKEEGMDYTRIFTGSYVENSESFGIEKNSLAPLSDKFISPWARSEEAGYINGGNKFDLNKWNPDYFKRLSDFVATAEELEIIVEVTFFSSIYTDNNWTFCPFYADNNINETDRIDREYVNTLRNGNLFAYQEKMVRKITRELNAFDNLIFEIQNEPWSDQQGKIDKLNKNVIPKEGQKWFTKSDLASDLSLEWQAAITRIIRDEEAALPKKHLIAQNYCNFRQAIAQVDKQIDIMNFHYAWPEAVHLNYGYLRPISFDESGFSQKEEATYRKQAWRFILAGGAVFNNLDYSFVAGHEDGSFEVNTSPGLGTKSLRKQFKFLRDFVHELDFIHMEPANHYVTHAPGFVFQALAKEGESYTIYFEGEGKCAARLKLPKGSYSYEWWSPETGKLIQSGKEKVQNEYLELEGPEVSDDLVLKLTKA
ncbi:MAG: hypothetical protein AAFR87_07865 [Bacteroidota bacterium]